MNMSIRFHVFLSCKGGANKRKKIIMVVWLSLFSFEEKKRQGFLSIFRKNRREKENQEGGKY